MEQFYSRPVDFCVASHANCSIKLVTLNVLYVTFFFQMQEHDYSQCNICTVYRAYYLSSRSFSSDSRLGKMVCYL